MSTQRTLSMTIIALATVAACSSVPPSNALLEEARSNYQAAQNNPPTRDLASGELRQAGDALSKADEAWTRRDAPAQVDHLAYLAIQRVAIAQETGKQKTAEVSIAQANATRDQLRLAARTDEADAAHRSADAAQRSAQASQLQSDESQRQSLASQQQATAAQLQTTDALARNSQLEAMLKDLNAKKTDRGVVISLGDVLFDTNKSQLKPGAMRNIEKLGAFLKQYPQRTALVEGYTDSVGSESSNEELSRRRADAVREALVRMGVSTQRIATHGYGEAYPVASNDNAAGRQMNRRIEIIVSNGDEVVAPRADLSNLPPTAAGRKPD